MRISAVNTCCPKPRFTANEKDNSFIIRSLYQREYNEYPLEGDINESRRIISHIKRALRRK